VGLALASRPASQYDNVMEKLPEDERYNLLLQGRCATLVEELGPKRGTMNVRPFTLHSFLMQAGPQARYKIVHHMMLWKSLRLQLVCHAIGGIGTQTWHHARTFPFRMMKHAFVL
jgi:hypothetical protein